MLRVAGFVLQVSPLPIGERDGVRGRLENLRFEFLICFCPPWRDGVTNRLDCFFQDRSILNDVKIRSGPGISLFEFRIYHVVVQ